jgi:hypothetical protein
MNKSEIAQRRFQKDLMILNFFFDTPIITRITLKMRITIFDQVLFLTTDVINLLLKKE